MKKPFGSVSAPIRWTVKIFHDTGGTETCHCLKNYKGDLLLYTVIGPNSILSIRIIRNIFDHNINSTRDNSLNPKELQKHNYLYLGNITHFSEHLHRKFIVF